MNASLLPNIQQLTIVFRDFEGLEQWGRNMIDIQKWDNGYLGISSSKQVIGNRIIWSLQLMVNLFGNFWS